MFELSIETKNSAFEGDNLHFEIARILKQMVIKIVNSENEGLLFDINGNCVGGYRLTNR